MAWSRMLLVHTSYILPVVLWCVEITTSSRRPPIHRWRDREPRRWYIYESVFAVLLVVFRTNTSTINPRCLSHRLTGLPDLLPSSSILQCPAHHLHHPAIPATLIHLIHLIASRRSSCSHRRLSVPAAAIGAGRIPSLPPHRQLRPWPAANL